MHKKLLAFWPVLLLLATLSPASSWADFEKGAACPDISAQDIYGETVDLDEIFKEDRDLVILFFFSVKAGQELALKLDALNVVFGGEEIEVVALGLEDEQAALRTFAEAMGIRYYIISKEMLADTAWRSEIEVLPTTLFIVPLDRRIERVLSGVSDRNINILTHVAENLYQQRKLEKAKLVTQTAIEKGENEEEARELKGFILSAEGKLDEAEKEFGAINSNAGLAHVAYEKGNFDAAVHYADTVPSDGYGQTVKGRALMKQGKLDEASSALDAASELEVNDWQRSELYNAQGRVAHQQGNTEAAIAKYEESVAVDVYNVVALSNQGAVYREKGELEKANEVLERASQLRSDDLATMMLQQIKRELQQSNNIARQELIRSQIKDLSERFEKMQETSAGEVRDEWTTTPQILAFLPPRGGSPVFFERAGTDIVLQREIETRFQSGGQIGIVERVMLDQLLQELNLGSSKLASADTQKRLGKVLSASMLGFIDFAQAGDGIMLYLRLVDTETTELLFMTSHQVDERNPTAIIDALIGEILRKLDSREVKGLVADASSEDAIIINIGTRHGVKVGGEFIALEEGKPITIGNRTIAVSQRPVGKLVVREAEADYAICEVVQMREGVKVAKEMRIKGSQ